MYYKDKTEVFKMRLTVEQLDFLKDLAGICNISKSAVVRMIIDTYRAKAVSDYENK